MLKRYLLDLLFPIQCLGGCGQWDTWLCKKCQQQIQQKNKIILKHANQLKGLYYIMDYKNPLIQKLIHQLKYSYSTEIAAILGSLLAQCLDQQFDYIIPIPLHKKRYCERGFNQSELLAKHLLPNSVRNDILIRTKNTQAQAQLDEKQRLQNMQNAFRNIKPEVINNKKILLVDDVYTTGNTLKQAAIFCDNADQIWAATIAKG